MKCHNFLCQNHQGHYKHTYCWFNCYKSSHDGKFVKDCESRKRYNRIMRAKTYGEIMHHYALADQLWIERNKYYGRGK